MDKDDKFNEDFKNFLTMLAAANKKREEEEKSTWAGNKAIAKVFMETFMAFQEVGFTRDEAFELIKVLIGNLGGKL